MSENRDNGGPAFPVEVDSTQPNARQTGNTVFQTYSMSLRDYTAIKAMAAFISTSGGPCIVGGLGGAEPEVAKAAYKMADAMLEARK